MKKHQQLSILIIISMALISWGCSMACMQKTYKDISAEEFINKYDHSPTIGYKYEYMGRKDGYHVMDYYDIGTKDWLEYRYSVRVKEGSLPPTFPDHPQPKKQ